MNGQKLRGLIGLALRARQASAGADACRILIRSGNCGILLLDGAAGPNTRKKAEALCRQAGVPLAVLPEGMIGEATGRSSMMIGLHQGSFADQIKSEFRDEDGGSNIGWQM